MMVSIVPQIPCRIQDSALQTSMPLRPLCCLLVEVCYSSSTCIAAGWQPAADALVCLTWALTQADLVPKILHQTFSNTEVCYDFGLTKGNFRDHLKIHQGAY